MQTVSEYYSVLDRSEGIGNLEVLCGGHFPDSAIKQLKRWRYWPELFEEAYVIIQERSQEQYRGAPTLASVMDSAMKRFLTRNGGTYSGGRNGSWDIHPEKQVPTVWVWTMNRLREQPAQQE
jgi:hypothetical protein